MNKVLLFQFVFILLFSSSLLAQSVSYHHGTVRVENEPYCLYKEISISNTNQGTRDSNFKDVAIYALDTLPVVYMEARVLSSITPKDIEDYNKYGKIKMSDDRPNYVNFKFVPINYYRIEFPSLQKEINFTYHKETLFYFFKDMVWFGVFINGKFNDKNAEKLIEKWSKKEIDYLHDTVISNGRSVGYLENPFGKLKEKIIKEEFKINFEEKTIKKNDTLIGSYIVENIPDTYHLGVASTYRPHYIISNSKGAVAGEIYSSSTSSLGAFIVHPDKSQIIFPLADKTAQKQVSIAVEILLQLGKL